MNIDMLLTTICNLASLTRPLAEYELLMYEQLCRFVEVLFKKHRIDTEDGLNNDPDQSSPETS